MTKQIAVLVVCLVGFSTLHAQNIEYNKKKNKFMVGEAPIAQLDTRKDNGWGFTRSFFLQDLQGANLISFLSESHKDTLFAEFHNWYRVEIPSSGLNFMIPDNAELNNEKYFVKLISENELLGADGKLKEDRCRAFASKNVYDFKAPYEKYNDSLKQLVSIPKVKVDRKRNRQVYADKFGKIGQDDIVIGHWDIYMMPNTMFGHVPTKYFIIRNMNGGIIATITTNGKLTTFDKKRWEENAMPGSELIQRPNEKDDDFMSRIGKYLTDKNML